MDGPLASLIETVGVPTSVRRNVYKGPYILPLATTPEMLRHVAEYKELKTGYRQAKALLASQKNAIIQLQDKMRLTEAKERRQATLKYNAIIGKKSHRKNPSHDESEDKAMAAMSLSSGSLRSVSTGSGSATSGSVRGDFDSESDESTGASESGTDRD